MRILLLALSLVATAGCARLIGGEAGVVLQSIVHGPAETELGRSTPAPRRERLAEADLWLPGTGTPTASVVLAPGMAEAGRDDPRLLPVAESLARAGFAVRVADQPGAQRLTLDPADPRRHLLRRGAGADRRAGRAGRARPHPRRLPFHGRAGGLRRDRRAPASRRDGVAA
jgi:hypothetical protein